MASGGREGLKTFDPSRMYDITAEERRAIQERAKLREGLRQEYQKKVTNPHRGVGGFIFDPVVQRFLSMRANHWEQFKPTPKNAAFAFFLGLGPIIFFSWWIYKDRTEFEAKCRRGEISYKDRDWKYI